VPVGAAGCRPVTTPLRVEAPAKLNLSLRMLGRREDGYHLLDSDFVLLDLADRLLLLPGCSGLRVEGVGAASVPLDADNLAWRGLVAGLGAEPDLVCLTLEKRIPAAAGLGGGSSDAAAAWRLGRAFRGLPDVATGQEELDALATIGADVPFFASGAAAARVTGIGERIRPVEGARRAVVLLHPPFGLATADVFAELRPSEWGSAENDLLPAARRLRPELDALMARMTVAGGRAQLTGTGPTIFAVFDDPVRAAAVAERLRIDGHSVTLTATRPAAAEVERIDEED
jgi:4-diphosphocytidyl-2-C-methyl-D-erythritol kinase